MSLTDNTTALRSILTAVQELPEAGSGGVTVQTKTGSFTTNEWGSASVECGFKPDIVAIHSDELIYQGYEYQLCFVFAAQQNDYPKGSVSYGDPYATVWAGITQETSGFSVSYMTGYSSSWAQATLANKTYNYTAFKFT